MIVIRQSRAGDEVTLKSLLDQSWHAHWAPHVLPSSVERYERERPAHGYVDKCWQDFMVAERDGEILGMYHLDGDYLQAIHVTPDAIGSGIGRALMKHAEERGAARLEVRLFNANAVQFYRHRGWIELREMDGSEMGSPARSILMVFPL